MERIVFFIFPLLVLISLELFAPRRKPTLSRLSRWPGAGLLLLSGVLLGRLLLPAGLAGLALWAQGQGIGLFNLIAVPDVWIWGLGLLALDLSVWAQHVAMHRVNFFWRFHRVHHADPDFDVFTALRFHPGELIISLAWKGTSVILLGLPALLVLWFEVILNLSAMFNHSNLKLPIALDRWLRLIIVTPDMHRVHHSTDHTESNRNFGFCIPWWDRIFKVYKDQPDQGHKAMQIGQSRWRGAIDQSFLALLRQPLEGKKP